MSNAATIVPNAGCRIVEREAHSPRPMDAGKIGHAMRALDDVHIGAMCATIVNRRPPENVVKRVEGEYVEGTWREAKGEPSPS